VHGGWGVEGQRVLLGFLSLAKDTGAFCGFAQSQFLYWAPGLIDPPGSKRLQCKNLT
jgi:hypothetical protein